MIELPNFDDAFFYENGFYLSCASSRIGKLIAHYELYRMTEGVPGDILECGVFRGASLMRFAAFRDLFDEKDKKLVGFDTFHTFPEAKFEGDRQVRDNFVLDTNGGESISRSQLERVIKQKSIENVELLEGDITETIPRYLSEHPDLEISLLNLDVDIYEPSVVILDTLFPRIVKNGILVLDDYDTFPGETQAVDEYFKDKDVEIEKLSFCKTPCYIKKT